MENLPKKEIRNETYNSLKNDLLSNKLSFESFINKLLEIDQSDPGRTASLENLKLLNDPEIVDFIKEKPEIFDVYYRFLSFTEFHVAQINAENGDCLKYFTDALAHAKDGHGDEAWIAYIEGTLLYMRGQSIPEDIIEKTIVLGNDRILRNFNKGLQERGVPSYLEDYSK